MRYRDWTIRLNDTIRAVKASDFAWGTLDCCLFAADCAVAVCGTDPAEDYRGKYSTEIGAKRALVKRHGSLEAAWDACFERVPSAAAQRGDICMHEAPDGMAVAVRWAGAWWGMTESGVSRVHAEPLIVWRIE